MLKLSEIIKNKSLKSDHRNKYEFQAYGNRLAEELHDTKHRALYIKLAKNEKRNHLEMARQYALSADNIDQKGKLFMWRLNQIKQESIETDE